MPQSSRHTRHSSFPQPNPGVVLMPVTSRKAPSRAHATKHKRETTVPYPCPIPYQHNNSRRGICYDDFMYETLQLQHRVHQIPWQGMWVCRRARCKNVQSICCVLTIINTGISQPTFGSCCGCCGSTLGPVPGPSPLSSPSRPSPPSPLPTQLLPRPPSILREEKPKRNRAWASVGWPTNRGTRFGGPPISWAR